MMDLINRVYVVSHKETKVFETNDYMAVKPFLEKPILGEVVTVWENGELIGKIDDWRIVVDIENKRPSIGSKRHNRKNIENENESISTRPRNQYRGICRFCGGIVEQNTGYVDKINGRNTVIHVECLKIKNKYLK